MPAINLSFWERKRRDSRRLQEVLTRQILTLPATLKEKDAKIYLDHYNSLSNQVPRSVRLETHGDVAKIIDHLRRYGDQTLNEIKQSLVTDAALRRIVGNEDAAQKALDFVLPLWAMVQTRGWREEQTLKQFITDLFPAPPISTPTTSTHRNDDDEEYSFNAYSLEHIGGLHLVWTSNLNDHLRLRPKSQEILIFRHASFLGTKADSSLL